MKDNLLFSGIPETRTEKNTEEVVKTFIKDNLNIERDIPFHVAHILCKRRDGRPRSIIV